MYTLFCLSTCKGRKNYPCNRPWRPTGCETTRLPHFLDNRLTDGGEVVSLTRRPPFTHRMIFVTHFCYRLSLPQGHSAAGRIRFKKSSNLVGNRTRDLPACSIVPLPYTYKALQKVNATVTKIHQNIPTLVY
jgi:hypothetical protein